jgi:hypothetical protein
MACIRLTTAKRDWIISRTKVVGYVNDGVANSDGTSYAESGKTGYTRSVKAGSTGLLSGVSSVEASAEVLGLW